MAAAPAAAPAAPAGPPPGWSPNGKQIQTPTLFLESVLEKLPGVKALFDAASANDERPTFTKVTRGEIGLEDGKVKKYIDMPIINLSRLSAAADDNHCWYDAFLQCMSPKYRLLSIPNRTIVFRQFRIWCKTNSDSIFKASPKTLYTEALSDTINKGNFKEDLDKLDRFTEASSGFIIAWYFGANILYLRHDINDGLHIVSEYAYQSPSCKAIFIYNTGNHYEPIGVFATGPEPTKQDESASTMIFEWTDPRLCAMKVLSTLSNDSFSFIFTTQREWTYPQVCDDPRSLATVNAHVKAVKLKEASRGATIAAKAAANAAIAKGVPTAAEAAAAVATNVAARRATAHANLAGWAARRGANRNTVRVNTPAVSATVEATGGRRKRRRITRRRKVSRKTRRR